jgi:hypothetical protein
MGKASKFKKIRKAAAQLPKLQRMAKIGSAVDASELIEQGISTVNDEPVLPGKKYRKVQSVPVQMNHNKIMKRAYNKYGKSGVIGYIQQVNNFAKQQSTK